MNLTEGIGRIDDPDAFLDVIDTCKDAVFLVSQEGDRVNLKSRFGQYLSLASMISNGYMDSLTIETASAEDAERIRIFLQQQSGETQF